MNSIGPLIIDGQKTWITLVRVHDPERRSHLADLLGDAASDSRHVRMPRPHVD